MGKAWNPALASVKLRSQPWSWVSTGSVVESNEAGDDAVKVTGTLSESTIQHPALRKLDRPGGSHSGSHSLTVNVGSRSMFHRLVVHHFSVVSISNGHSAPLAASPSAAHASRWDFAAPTAIPNGSHKRQDRARPRPRLDTVSTRRRERCR